MENLLKEAVALALFEQMAPTQQIQAPQPPPPPPAPPANAQPAPSPDDQAPQNQQVSQMELTLDSVIERLNIIRGGKSFTDPEIYGKLTTAFKALTPEAKFNIDSFLRNVSEIMTNVNQGTDSSNELPQDQAMQMQGNVGNQNVQQPVSAPTPGANMGATPPVTPTNGMNPAGM